MVAKNLKLTVFIFKSMEHCSKPYDVKLVNNGAVLEHQHQWKLEQKKIDSPKVLEVDKNNGAKTMENIVLYLKLLREVGGSIGLCGQTPHQCGNYLTWIFY